MIIAENFVSLGSDPKVDYYRARSLNRPGAVYLCLLASRFRGVSRVRRLCAFRDFGTVENPRLTGLIGLAALLFVKAAAPVRIRYVFAALSTAHSQCFPLRISCAFLLQNFELTCLYFISPSGYLFYKIEGEDRERGKAI